MWEVNKPVNTADLGPLMMSRGLMNVSGLIRIADEVCESVFNQIGLGKTRAVTAGETVFTAAVHVNSFRPIEISQSFYSEVVVVEVGKRKFTTKTRFQTEGGELLAEVDTVHVCYDLKEKATIEIPRDVLERIRAMYENNTNGPRS